MTINSDLQTGSELSTNEKLQKTLIYFTLAVQSRGSYMSAHVLLNLLNELGKSEKMRCLPSILSVFFSQRV